MTKEEFEVAMEHLDIHVDICGIPKNIANYEEIVEFALRIKESRDHITTLYRHNT